MAGENSKLTTSDGLVIHSIPDWLCGWELLLQKWADLMGAYDDPDENDRDVAYWYGERALCGLLVAAAWQLEEQRGWALEEFDWRTA